MTTSHDPRRSYAGLDDLDNDLDPRSAKKIFYFIGANSCVPSMPMLISDEQIALVSTSQVTAFINLEL